MNLDLFKKQCLNHSFVIELIQFYSPNETTHPDELNIFFEALDKVASDNIQIVEDFFFKETLTDEESLLFAKLLVDLKTSSKIMKLKYNKDIKKIISEYGWKNKLDEFLKNSNTDWRLDPNTQKIHFFNQVTKEKSSIPNILWTNVLETLGGRDKPFFYLFALTMIEDEDILNLKNSFIYYLSKNLIKA